MGIRGSNNGWLFGWLENLFFFLPFFFLYKRPLRFSVPHIFYFHISIELASKAPGIYFREGTSKQGVVSYFFFRSRVSEQTFSFIYLQIPHKIIKMCFHCGQIFLPKICAPLFSRRARRQHSKLLVVEPRSFHSTYQPF